MSVDHTAVLPECAECLDVWLPSDEERWRAFVDDGNLSFFCPGCAEREFGELRHD
jgi:hypothetical protein